MHKDAVIHEDLVQGSEEWLAARNGLLTASEVKHLMSAKTLKPSNNEKTRAHVWEIAAQRITGYTEPSFIGDEMLRGHVDEEKARDLYSEHFEPVLEVGFITRDVTGGGCTIGYSPDGMLAISNGGIEVKSRRQKFQIQTIVEDEVPEEHALQVQTGLLVTKWDFIDYLSYSGGLPLWRIRAEPDPVYHDAIQNAAYDFEKKVREVIENFGDKIAKAATVIETERDDDEQEMTI
jgi:hypothetical protein